MFYPKDRSCHNEIGQHNNDIGLTLRRFFFLPQALESRQDMLNVVHLRELRAFQLRVIRNNMGDTR